MKHVLEKSGSQRISRPLRGHVRLVICALFASTCLGDMFPCSRQASREASGHCSDPGA